MDISKDMELDEMVPDLVYRHFKKIRESDAVLVVNPDGYIGNSVKVEIGYAKGLGKKVYFLEKTNAPELDCLADEILEANKFDVFR
ncbi:nucleoside 2-deoxyribosyltransferase [Patescibacteria group bacterium]|nr:nucleoside 2-deoxyribosyltransferase [Patescibacteria group bacterium]